MIEGMMTKEDFINRASCIKRLSVTPDDLWEDHVAMLQWEFNKDDDFHLAVPVKLILGEEKTDKIDDREEIKNFLQWHAREYLPKGLIYEIGLTLPQDFGRKFCYYWVHYYETDTKIPCDYSLPFYMRDRGVYVLGYYKS